jgi:hypothetical protein
MVVCNLLLHGHGDQRLQRMWQGALLIRDVSDTMLYPTSFTEHFLTSSTANCPLGWADQTLWARIHIIIGHFQSPHALRVGLVVWKLTKSLWNPHNVRSWS